MEKMSVKPRANSRARRDHLPAEADSSLPNKKAKKDSPFDSTNVSFKSSTFNLNSSLSARDPASERIPQLSTTRESSISNDNVHVLMDISPNRSGKSSFEADISKPHRKRRSFPRPPKRDNRVGFKDPLEAARSEILTRIARRDANLNGRCGEVGGPDYFPSDSARNSARPGEALEFRNLARLSRENDCYDANIDEEDLNAVIDMYDPPSLRDAVIGNITTLLPLQDSPVDQEAIQHVTKSVELHSATSLLLKLNGAEDSKSVYGDISDSFMLASENDMPTSTEAHEEFDVDETLLYAAEADSFHLRPTVTGDCGNGPASITCIIGSNHTTMSDSLGLHVDPPAKARQEPILISSSPSHSILEVPPVRQQHARRSNTPSQLTMSPFVRRPFPPVLNLQSYIHGISSDSSLKVCFRMADVFTVASTPKQLALHSTFVEFYGSIVDSRRVGNSQNFQFADIFFPHRGPYICGLFENCHLSSLSKNDIKPLNDANIDHVKWCRVVGILTRTANGNLSMKVLSIWQADQEDVQWVRGIVSPVEESPKKA